MWKPDGTVTGPHRASRRDVAALNRLFSEAFTERYRRDGMTGVRVPHLNPLVWHYALANAGEGAMLWRDGRGDLLAFNLAHCSGREGWMGPLAVRTDRQGQGLGSRIVRAGIEWLQAQGCATIGLETMPRTIENIGFYARLGFRPGPLTITMQAEATRHDEPGGIRLTQLPLSERTAWLAACLALTAAVSPGSDYTRECDLTLQLEIGDLHCLGAGAESLDGFALWHAVPLAESRHTEELRVLKLVARDLVVARRLLAAVGDEASRRRIDHLTLRCQANQRTLFGALVEAGWQVQWTDLRMTLEGFPEVPAHGVVLSNWEI